ncbi:UNVERIFIED_CONTAM: hypothetical protein Sradi_2417200 [Sesamum radiatum]|uniref:Glycosyl transferase family 1 domain-containing protein n=1 Tax=Sesamum radiatum TaxID=300843 RepID=A0AAW2SHL7_SESRA
MNNIMAKHSMTSSISVQKRWPMLILLCIALSTAIAFFIGASFNSCNSHDYSDNNNFNTPIHSFNSEGTAATKEENPLSFMKSKLVLMVSHELSLSVMPAKGQEAVDIALRADLVILNTAVAGKWLDAVLQENVARVLPKVLWWIHEMRGHYFKLEYVKHLPFVAGAMIDSHTTAEYWKNRTREQLGIKMPDTYVLHLGNSKDLMEVAEDRVARRVLREHIRESLGVRKDDLLFAIINSVSRGKGQDLFLKAFYEAVQLSQEKKLKVPPMHAVIVGSDMGAQTKFETELRKFVADKKIQESVHFVNKTLNVAPYLASIDVLVQNSQARGECFGRITIEAMAFQLPVLGTAAGGTMEIVVNGTTGWLHPTGKEGVTPLAGNIIRLATDIETRRTMGMKGYNRVKEMFLEHHMSHRISLVLKEVLQKTKKGTH